jgi:hypothetical protein
MALLLSTRLAIVASGAAMKITDDEDLFIDGAFFRPLSPRYYAYLRSCVMGAKAALLAGELSAADWAAVNHAFVEVRQHALEQFGEERLRVAVANMEGGEINSYAPPGTNEIDLPKTTPNAIMLGVLDQVAEMYGRRSQPVTPWVVRELPTLHRALIDIENALEDAVRRSDRRACLRFAYTWRTTWAVAIRSIDVALGPSSSHPVAPQAQAQPEAELTPQDNQEGIEEFARSYAGEPEAQEAPTAPQPTPVPEAQLSIFAGFTPVAPKTAPNRGELGMKPGKGRGKG